MGVFDEVAGLSDVSRGNAGQKLGADAETQEGVKRAGSILDWLSLGPLAAVVTPKEAADVAVDAYQTAQAVAKTPEQAKEAVSTAKIVGFGALAVGAIVGVGYAASSLAKLVR